MAYRLFLRKALKLEITIRASDRVVKESCEMIFTDGASQFLNIAESKSLTSCNPNGIAPSSPGLASIGQSG